MDSRTRRRQGLRHRPGPGFEPLEARRVLAYAAFEFELYEDAGGAPGATLDADAIEVGQSFYVEVRAQEFDPMAYGLQSVALDIAWDPAVLRPLEGDVTEAITDHLPAFRSGAVDEEAGRITNLAGSSLGDSDLGKPIGGLGAEAFALLRFEAIADAGATSLTMAQGQSRIVPDPVLYLADAQLEFETQTLAVGAAEPVEAIAQFVAPKPVEIAADPVVVVAPPEVVASAVVPTQAVAAPAPLAVTVMTTSAAPAAPVVEVAEVVETVFEAAAPQETPAAAEDPASLVNLSVSTESPAEGDAPETPTVLPDAAGGSELLLVARSRPARRLELAAIDAVFEHLAADDQGASTPLRGRSLLAWARGWES